MKAAMFFILLPVFLFAQDVQKKAPPLRYTAALFSRGDSWDSTKTPNEQPYFSQHGKNLKRLKEEGKIAIGARFGEFGMVVFKSDNAEEVRSFFSNDSLVLMKYLKMELHPFNPFYKGCIE